MIRCASPGSRRIDHDPVIQSARRDNARFSILPTIIHPRQVSARENARGVPEVESSLGERLVPLGPIKYNSNLSSLQLIADANRFPEAPPRLTLKCNRNP